MRATLQALRLHDPARLVAAVPVGSVEACQELLSDADEVICLYEPDPFYSVGTHYGDFKAPEDDLVRRILQDFNPGGSSRTVNLSDSTIAPETSDS